MTKNKNALFSGILFISILSIIFFMVKRHEQKREISIDENSSSTICKVFEVKQSRSVTRANYYFYHNGQKYKGSKMIKGNKVEYINQFFSVLFSSKNPEYSEINLDSNITDSLKITNAGFIYSKLIK